VWCWICRAYAKENRLSDMERLVERMKIAGIAPPAATFLETLESFGLSSESGETLTESAVEVPANDDDEDDDVSHDDVVASEGTENSSSDILNLSSDKDE
jgi:pentatricopeptide repeat protein